MNNIKVAVIVGSLRRESYNRKLAKAVEKLMPAEIQFNYIRIDDLPLFSQDIEADYPPAARRLKDEIKSSDALLFVTPEYNRSMPGVLKNAIDVASRPWGTNSFAGKPGAVMGTSIGAAGTALAQQHLRNSLVFVDVPVLAQPEVLIQYKDGLIDPDGNITNETTRKFLQGFVERYLAWIKRFLPAQLSKP
ncbi:MAG: NADPH-dependent FMN reductase [Gammaproteobacteria bacterium]